MNIYDTLIALTFLISGTVSLAAGIKGFLQIFRIKHGSSYVRLPGVIVHLGQPPNARYNVVIPVVRFEYEKTPQLKPVHVQSLKVKYKAGDEVYIYFNPDSDEKYVRTETETKYIYPFLLIAMGVIFAACAFFAAAVQFI
jgi:hypothetical protein